MRHDWVQNRIAQLTTAQFSFIQFITALNESIQLQEELSRARAPEIGYGLYINDTGDVCRLAKDS